MNSVLGNSSGAGADSITHIKFTAATTGSLNKILVYTGAGGNNIAAAIYSDSAGAPDVLLGSTPTVATAATTWNECTLSSAVSVTSGTVYWLTWTASSDVTNQFKWAAGGANQRASDSNTYPPFPDPAAVASNANQVWSLYGVYDDTVVAGAKLLMLMGVGT